MKDWVGAWYQVAKTSDRVGLGLVNVEKKDVQWLDFSHAQTDGLGALLFWSKDQNLHLQLATPKTKITLPSWQLRPRLFWRALKNFSGTKPQWAKQLPFTPLGPHDYNYDIYSPQEYQEIKNKLQKEQIGLNAWALSKLNSLLFEHLLQEQSSGQWLFPVSLRSTLASKDEDPRRNFSSCLALPVKKTTSAEDLQLMIKHKLSMQEHWGHWWMFNIGRVIRTPGIRYLSERSRQKSFWLGTFTNLGEISCPELTEQAIIVAPPGSPNYPIGVGLMCLNQHWSVSLKIHPWINDRPQLAQEILAKFRQMALS